MRDPNVMPKGTKRLFLKLGTCAQTMCFILNREFDNNSEVEEYATDPLAGGILRQGYQCGMLWGSALALGAESFHRNGDTGRAVGVAIKATQQVMDSFTSRTKAMDCIDITDCDFSSKISTAKYMLTGKFLSCFTLMDKWAPEAIQVAKEGLAKSYTDLPGLPVSCASRVVSKMGGGARESVMVAGFAGGIGLSGDACGALGAAIWMDSINWCRNNSLKTAHSNPAAKKRLSLFYHDSNYEILCHKVAGRHFASIEEHSEFVKSGGCEKLINSLAQAL